MKHRFGQWVGWICVILVSALNVFAVIGKFSAVVPGSAAQQYASQLGIEGIEHQLGVLEIIVMILYIWPRTSTAGTVLMAGYLGGALSACITHGFSTADNMGLYIALVLLAIGAWFRNPELKTRLMTGKA